MCVVSVGIEGVEGEIAPDGIYSVIFTEQAGKTLFEVRQLKGSAKSHGKMAADLQKAKDWLDAMELKREE
jgi:hypothetical protein